MDSKNEKYADQKFNNDALLQAAGIVGQENSHDVNKMTKDDEFTEGALMYTYHQVIDSYREGTLDPHVSQRNTDSEMQ